jgi:hypothetical protein
VRGNFAKKEFLKIKLWQDVLLKPLYYIYGEDAVRFLNEMRNVKPASYDEKKRVREAYEMLKNIATFRL